MEKYYRVFAQVDLDAIADNLREIINYKESNTEIMAVIKADGYGHGAIPIAKTLIDNGVNRLGVATIEEGIALRKSGFDIPILILGYTPDAQIEHLITYDLIQTVFKVDMAKVIQKVASRVKKKVRIHVKVDTGMGRIGFLPNEQSLTDIEEIQSMNNIELEGIFTHFSKADESDKSFTYHQLDQFFQFIKRLEKRGIRIPVKHTSNSAGFLEFKEAHLDLIRIGIAIYGMYPSQDVSQQNVPLKPALTLKSHVVFVKEVEAGTPISYGGIYTTSSKTKIATIPVGYGDGYPRLLSSIGRVLIKGEYAPIIGRVCMDQFMVDVTHIPNVDDGDEVVLIGKQGNREITAEELAELTGTINYEITCGLGKRIPRIYVSKGECVHFVDYFNVE